MLIDGIGETAKKQGGFFDSLGDFLTKKSPDGGASIADSLTAGAQAIVTAKTQAKLAKYNAQSGGNVAIADYMPRSAVMVQPEPAFNAADLVGGKTGMVLLAALGVAGAVYFAVKSGKKRR
jgi:hypothetical protein